MRRTGIWPALSDLYAGLFVTCLAGLLVVAPPPPPPPPPYPPIEAEAHIISSKLRDELPLDLRQRSRIQTGDLYVEVILNFNPDSDDLKTQDDVAAVHHVAMSLEKALAAEPQDAAIVDIWVEGHTDSRNPAGIDPRALFMYNWRLSSSRAASVLYEMANAGLRAQPDRRRIHAIGYADTRPLVPAPKIAADWMKNRRTTFRLHPDRCLIDARINNRSGSYCSAGSLVAPSTQ